MVLHHKNHPHIRFQKKTSISKTKEKKTANKAVALTDDDEPLICLDEIKSWKSNAYMKKLLADKTATPFAEFLHMLSNFRSKNDMTYHHMQDLGILVSIPMYFL